MAKDGKISRRTYLVYPRLQLAVIGYAVLLSMFCLVGPFLFSFLFAQVLSDWPPKTDDLGANLLTAVPLFITLVGAMAYGLILSNRIVGPIYRVNKQMIEYMDGEGKKPVKFRENDFWFSFGETYNQFIENLPEKPTAARSDKVKFPLS
jgi:hypothetical protein